jgi:hypothetical protein
MMSIYKQLTGEKARTSVGGPLAKDEGVARGPLIRFLKACSPGKSRASGLSGSHSATHPHPSLVRTARGLLSVRWLRFSLLHSKKRPPPRETAVRS